MKTYTVDANGIPALAFRAEDDAEAAAWLESPVGRLLATDFPEFRGKALTVRPATIPERAEWVASSVDRQLHRESERGKKTADELGVGPFDPDQCWCTFEAWDELMDELIKAADGEEVH